MDRPTELALADANLPPFSPEEAQALLRECLKLFVAAMRKAARTSSDTASDLFEGKHLISDKEELDFLIKREEWVHRFADVLGDLFDKRLAGTKRRGRRPDTDVSLSTLRVLNPFDQEKQAAITLAARNLQRWARKELDALDLRVSVLFEEPLLSEVDNPFGPDYIIDAVGVSARALFPNPRLWRPFMERVLGDITPAVPKSYITLNRLLADRGVLPEIKAALRARSELRPADDKDLLPLFQRLLQEAGPNIEAINIEVPPILGGPAAALPGRGPSAGAGSSAATAPMAGAASAPLSSAPGAAADQTLRDGPLLDIPLPAAVPSVPPPAETRAAVQATAAAWPGTAPRPAPSAASDEANAFPSLEPLLAMGSSSPVFELLEQWQSFDPQNEATQRDLKARGVNTAALPLNRMPYLRIALGPETISPTDKITMDVISLLFDYIFRDPSIPESTRGIFGRLQVPILKAALLERTFFSDKTHPARRVLDRLAAGAVGAASEKTYRIAFEGVASRIVDMIGREFALDVEVFERADRELRAFLEGETRQIARAIDPDIDAALQAEAREADGAHAHALVRDRLAGLQLPLDVRMFAETAWADYLTSVRQQHGEDSEAYRGALQTMDDLLWSITAKERSAQKARLTKMVPGIIQGLRKGCAAVRLPDERAKTFFDTLYELHIAAIKPRSKTGAAASAAAMHAGSHPAGPAAIGSGSTIAAPARTRPGGHRAPQGSAADAADAESTTAEEEAAVETGGFSGTDNYHDYVSEMAVGTWLAFRGDNAWINARLTWVSPLRTKYIFTSRSRTSAFVRSPEELALELGMGRARLVVEPVPLFDRAVSAALDSIAAQKTAAS